MFSKNWPFLFDILTELFILDFKHFSFWLRFRFTTTRAFVSLLNQGHGFCWFIPSCSFLFCIRIFYIFLSLIAKNMCWTWKHSNFLIHSYFSSVPDSSKEQNKLSTSAVYHKHYCYITFLSRFAVRLPSKIAVICSNYNHSWRRDNFFFFFNFSQYFDLQ